MKKFIFVIIITVIGFKFTAFFLVYAVMNPCVYNRISGLKGAFLSQDTGTPFITSMIVMVIGLCICFYEAYLRKKYMKESFI